MDTRKIKLQTIISRPMKSNINKLKPLYDLEDQGHKKTILFKSEAAVFHSNFKAENGS